MLDFSESNILVLGDIMVDHYVVGSVHRMSPEAPVPVLEQESETYKLGGAANVARNIVSLGASATLVGIIGDDTFGKMVYKLCEKSNIELEAISVDEKCTTVKSRFISGSEQLLRLDRENSNPISSDVVERILNRIEALALHQKFDAIILQDYNKGLFTSDLIEKVISLAQSNQWIIAVDPKIESIEHFTHVDIFKPNRKEFFALAKKLNLAGELEVSLPQALAIKEHMLCKSLWVTLGEKGVYYHDESGNEAIVPTTTNNIVDVCGAGDAVISMITLSTIKNLSSEKIAILANLAGGLVCEELGVVPVRIEDVNQRLST